MAAKTAQPKLRVERLVLLQTMHLGFCKELFPAGSEIEHHVDEGFMLVNGREFQDCRDLPILKRNRWVAEYDQEAAGAMIAESTADLKMRKPQRLVMPITLSDEDQVAPVDVRGSKVGRVALLAQEKARMAAVKRTADERRTAKMEVVPGEETVEQRQALRQPATRQPLARSDIRPEIRIDDEEPQVRGMKVIRDGGNLGAGMGSKQSSLNAGETTGRKSLTPDELEEMRQEGRRKAAVGIDTRNEIRAKMGLAPLPESELQGADSSGVAQALGKPIQGQAKAKKARRA